jgi:hypothetical protein
MEKPNSPNGWVITDWNYLGTEVRDYPASLDDLTIFAMKHEADGENVYLLLHVNRHGKPERFAAYQTYNCEPALLTRNLASAKAGIDFCCNFAAKYADQP